MTKQATTNSEYQQKRKSAMGEFRDLQDHYAELTSNASIDIPDDVSYKELIAEGRSADYEALCQQAPKQA
jgi:hypothetical protein